MEKLVILKLFRKIKHLEAERNRRQKNTKRAKEAAEVLFPGEIWLKKAEWGERIYVSSRRKTGVKSNFKDELRDAQILRDSGSTVYLVPEDKKIPGKKYDAIVDGLQMEFKNMSGTSRETLIDHFYGSRQQAPNVFLNLEVSPLSKDKILRILIGARNSPKYHEKNLFYEEGIIIIKNMGHEDLIYLNIDDLKI